MAQNLLDLHHRGPDASGTVLADVEWGHVACGMARLKIVDQSDLTVPLVFDHLGVTVAYNGEVYNWQELRAELSDGTPWATQCDVEVIARAWRKWGPEMLWRFNGMWGLVLIDTRKNEVFIARDRAGEKPVYLSHVDGVLHVASEIKALGVPLVEQSCVETDTLEYDCLSGTPFKDVYALPPAHYLHLTDGVCADPQWRWQPWWELPRDADKADDRWDLVDELAALLRDSITLRSNAEVPVAVMLSGGLDSSIIQAVARSQNLYCVDFPGQIDNLSFAQQAAQGRTVRPVTFGYQDLIEALPQIAWHLDTPATWTAVCQWFMAQHMGRDGIKVVLSGEGADELFCGYARHRVLWHLDQARQDPLLASYGPTLDYLVGGHTQVLGKLLDRSGGARLPHAQTLVERYGISDGGLAESMASVEFHTTMQVLLRMADRMTAAASIENRSPFLDYRVMEWAARLPAEHKIDAQWTKAILRDVAETLGVPATITRNPQKRGLAVPWQAWAGSEGGDRGAWDRKRFASMMRTAWRDAFFALKRDKAPLALRA